MMWSCDWVTVMVSVRAASARLLLSRTLRWISLLTLTVLPVHGASTIQRLVIWVVANRVLMVPTGGVHSQRIRPTGVSMTTVSYLARTVCTPMIQVMAVRCMSIRVAPCSLSSIPTTVRTSWPKWLRRQLATPSMWMVTRFS